MKILNLRVAICGLVVSSATFFTSASQAQEYPGCFMVSSGLLFDLSAVCGGKPNAEAAPASVPVAESRSGDPFTVTTTPVSSSRKSNAGPLARLASLYNDISDIERNYFSAIRSAAASLSADERNSAEAELANQNAELERFHNFCNTGSSGDGAAGQLRRQVAPSFCSLVETLADRARDLEETLPPSRSSQEGSCNCPYDTDSRGRRCGERSAFSRSAGRSAACYIR